MKSATEKGTLYQLRNLLNRTNVVANPSKDFNACDDFFQLIVRSHIVVAAFLGAGNTFYQYFLHQVEQITVGKQ